MTTIWLAVDKDGSEGLYGKKPIGKDYDMWLMSMKSIDYLEVPHGTIKALIGRELTWNDKPVEYKGE